MRMMNMSNSNSRLDSLCINTIRTLSIDGVEKAKSGHPGMPMGMAPTAYLLWTKYLRHNPANPKWPNRDRFVLSAGHGSMLLYSLLHLTGYDLPLEELMRFRQLHSKTPGHPEYGLAPGVETTTGPLGQGFSNAVGMAIAQKYLAAYFNRPGYPVFDYKIYGIVSDGDLMEGVSHESASLAGHLKLDNIVYFYDDNKITIDGETSLSFSEDVRQRFEAYGWFVEDADGNDLASVEAALKKCLAQTDKPSLIKTRTTIGFGSPNKQNTAEVHGAALGEEEVKLTKLAYGWDPEKVFYIPRKALDHFRKAMVSGKAGEGEWNELYKSYRSKFPMLADKLDVFLGGKFSVDWDIILPVFTPKDGKLATRQASGKTLEALSGELTFLIGGSADLTPSNNTRPKAAQDFSAENRLGKYIRFGVREHAMGSVMNGIALSGLRPYGGTFLIFSDYMRPAIRLASLMKLPVIYVFTHDSIGLGEDGPTHQPIEHLPSLRAIHGLRVIRPADANETTLAWKMALEQTDGPTALALTRQGLPVIDRTRYAPSEEMLKGGYVLADDTDPELILIASGSEVSIALDAYEHLRNDGVRVRVVNLPCWEIFEEQTREYRDEVILPHVSARLAIEAAAPFGWERYVGTSGECIAINRFGESAPVAAVMKEFGFTSENIVLRAKNLLQRVRSIDIENKERFLEKD
jgi:transketolase